MSQSPKRSTSTPPDFDFPHFPCRRAIWLVVGNFEGNSECSMIFLPNSEGPSRSFKLDIKYSSKHLGTRSPFPPWLESKYKHFSSLAFPTLLPTWYSPKQPMATDTAASLQTTTCYTCIILHTMFVHQPFQPARYIHPKPNECSGTPDQLRSPAPPPVWVAGPGTRLAAAHRASPSPHSPQQPKPPAPLRCRPPAWPARLRPCGSRSRTPGRGGLGWGDDPR